MRSGSFTIAPMKRASIMAAAIQSQLHAIKASLLAGRPRRHARSSRSSVEARSQSLETGRGPRHGNDFCHGRNVRTFDSPIYSISLTRSGSNL